MMNKLIKMAENGSLPDFLIKAGIRLPLTWLDEKYHDILVKSLNDAGIILKH